MKSWKYHCYSSFLLSIQENPFDESLHAIHVLCVFHALYTKYHQNKRIANTLTHIHTPLNGEKIGNSKLRLHIRQKFWASILTCLFDSFFSFFFTYISRSLSLSLSVSFYYSIMKLMFLRIPHEQCPSAKIYQTDICVYEISRC